MDDSKQKEIEQENFLKGIKEIKSVCETILSKKELLDNNTLTQAELDDALAYLYLLFCEKTTPFVLPYLNLIEEEMGALAMQKKLTEALEDDTLPGEEAFVVEAKRKPTMH